jgi:hypothetical protein
MYTLSYIVTMYRCRVLSFHFKVGEWQNFFESRRHLKSSGARNFFRLWIYVVTRSKLKNLRYCSSTYRFSNKSDTFTGTEDILGNYAIFLDFLLTICWTACKIKMKKKSLETHLNTYNRTPYSTLKNTKRNNQ